MNGTRMHYAKRNKSEKDKYNMISVICGIYKTKQMSKEGEKRERQTKKQTLDYREQLDVYQRGGG